MRRLAAGFCGLALLWFAVVGCSSLNAQSSGNAGIQGQVVDPTGAPIPHAKITATNTDTQVKTTGESDGVGAYSLSPLQPGNYTVVTTAKGFALLVQDVTVKSGATLSLQLKLMVGLGGSSAEVRGEHPPIPTMATLLRSRIAHAGPPAAVPLFRDPIHNGAADPVVVYNRARKTWWMFYTNRRADLDDNSGVTWVHGTRIGIAESSDGGATWHYVSEADVPVAAPDYTLWAPEVIDVNGTYHMFLTVVPGTFTDWMHPRHIQHLTSKDLLHWTPLADANLESESTIDACVFRLPTGEWRLWYKNEADGSKVYFSDSPDLIHWTHKGIATTNHGEGPVVFQWHGAYWLINDPHAGLGVFRSDDLTTWHQQPNNILREPGTQPTDKAVGSHADVVVDAAGRAWLFYFTQQGGENASANTKGYGRHSVLHVTELHEANGIITTDRNAPAYIHLLPPPKNKKSDTVKAW
jgi:Carboxypeptidase regulatory-like domain/Glycosyl hydrolases family 43